MSSTILIKVHLISEIRVYKFPEFLLIYNKGVGFREKRVKRNVKAS